MKGWFRKITWKTEEIMNVKKKSETTGEGQVSMEVCLWLCSTKSWGEEWRNMLHITACIPDWEPHSHSCRKSHMESSEACKGNVVRVWHWPHHFQVCQMMKEILALIPSVPLWHDRITITFFLLLYFILLP